MMKGWGEGVKPRLFVELQRLRPKVFRLENWKTSTLEKTLFIVTGGGAITQP
jgi:hypothetical protein